MVENFGYKCGVDEKGGNLFVCIFPPLCIMLGGVWVIYFTISSYYSDLEFGILDAEDLEPTLRYGIITGSIVFGIGLILLMFLVGLKFLYKSGFFSPYGFSFNHETKMITVHSGHKKKEFYIGDLIGIKVNNNMLDKSDLLRGIYNYYKAPYGFIKLIFLVNGKKKTAKPFGLIECAQCTADYIDYLSYQEVKAKQNHGLGDIF